MIMRVTTVKTKDGRGTFALVDKADAGGSWRSVGVTRTYWTASQAVRARSNGHTIARRYFKAHGTGITPLKIEDAV